MDKTGRDEDTTEWHDNWRWGGRGRGPKGTETDPISRVDIRVGRLDRRDGDCCAGDEIDVSYPVPSDKSTKNIPREIALAITPDLTETLPRPPPSPVTRYRTSARTDTSIHPSIPNNTRHNSSTRFASSRNSVPEAHSSPLPVLSDPPP